MKRTVLNLLHSVLIILLILLASSIETIAQLTPVWQTITIPDLPAGTALGSVWARTRSEAYVWAYSTNSLQSFLFRWDGASWGQALALTNHFGSHVFGTGPSDVFVTASYYPDGPSGAELARVFRSADNGTNWAQQVLPDAVTNSALSFGYIGGTPNNVHVQIGAGSIVRFDGTTWSLIFSETNRGIYGLTLVSPNEGYYVTCFDWGSWDGTSWVFRGLASLGCDVYGGVWGTRAPGGSLSLYAAGQNSFNNGVHVWSFNETNQTWGEVFADGSNGNGTGVWGSASNDVYVVGELISGATHSGRVYHYDGADWSQITSVGAISSAASVSGTGPDDVWVSLRQDAKLLHYSPPLLTVNVYAGLTISGKIGATYQIQYSNDLSNTNNWVVLTNLTLPSYPYLFFDGTSAGRPRRFYQALLVP